eukprot:CAMPEP_0175024510 /NCGR_PEP_ID=MMETSP0005-20121125/16504_1 /TAXON_ID=420556 /ORGANISM="Ochromonas sp., Strain CCMP1393" /LENGTH=204 /DNA_ID=CAMNT_0016283065 /DNA_START=98 /DNA_END=709 /DNA_ORIENTATION=+
MTENYSDMPRVKTSVSPSSVRQTATSGDTVADDRHRKKLSSRKLLQEETAHDPIRLRKAMESAEAAAFGAKNAETDVRNFAVDIQELLGKGTEKSTKELESRISIFASRMTISNKKAAIAADEAFADFAVSTATERESCHSLSLKETLTAEQELKCQCCGSCLPNKIDMKRDTDTHTSYIDKIKTPEKAAARLPAIEHNVESLL